MCVCVCNRVVAIDGSEMGRWVHSFSSFSFLWHARLMMTSMTHTLPIYWSLDGSTVASVIWPFDYEFPIFFFFCSGTEVPNEFRVKIQIIFEFPTANGRETIWLLRPNRQQISFVKCLHSFLVNSNSEVPFLFLFFLKWNSKWPMNERKKKTQHNARCRNVSTERIWRR
jgi:hypothetical protein